MNEIVPAPSNNDKIVTAKGKPGKYLREKNNTSGLHSSDICDCVNPGTVRDRELSSSSFKNTFGWDTERKMS